MSDGTRAVNFSYTGGTLTGVTDAAGHAWTYAYVGSGGANFVALLGQVSEPLGNTPLTQTFDANGRVLTQTDALGHVANYAWGAAVGNTFTDPLGNTWTYQHDAGAGCSRSASPVSGSWLYAYDTNGRLISRMRPLGDASTVAYDPTSGNPSQASFADGSSVNWAYASHSIGGAVFYDLAQVTYPDATHESFSHDAAGNLTSFTDRGGLCGTAPTTRAVSCSPPAIPPAA